MRQYELMMIHRSDLAEPDVREEITALQSTIGESGAVETTDFWGKRRFAYEIDHMHEGYYSVVEFQADADVVAGLDRALLLSDTVVRHKILRRYDKE